MTAHIKHILSTLQVLFAEQTLDILGAVGGANFETKFRENEIYFILFYKMMNKSIFVIVDVRKLYPAKLFQLKDLLLHRHHKSFVFNSL